MKKGNDRILEKLENSWQVESLIRHQPSEFCFNQK